MRCTRLSLHRTPPGLTEIAERSSPPRFKAAQRVLAITALGIEMQVPIPGPAYAWLFSHGRSRHFVRRIEAALCHPLSHRHLWWHSREFTEYLDRSDLRDTWNTRQEIVALFNAAVALEPKRQPRGGVYLCGAYP